MHTNKKGRFLIRVHSCHSSPLFFPCGSVSRAKSLQLISLLFLLTALPNLCSCASHSPALPALIRIDARDSGAIGDGTTLDTAAIQSAIDSAANSGGGTVVLAGGRFVSGTLLLRSHVTLQIDPGAALLGSTKYADYRGPSSLNLPMPKSNYPQDEMRFRGLLIALDAEDITVTGGGTVDGRGAVVAAAIHQMQVDHQLAGNPKYRPDEMLRPCVINFVACRHVRVSNITLRDSACWVENYSACKDLTVEHVRVRSQAFWNNDGIDITGCQHVRMNNCDIDSADDGICLKSNAQACEDVIIRDCRVRSWANAIKFGTVSFVGFKNITISHIQVWGCGHAGLSIESVDGATIDDVTVSDISMTNLRQAILVKLGSRHTPGGNVGAIRNVSLSNITADLADGDPDAGQKFRAPVPSYKHNRFPCVVSGLPGHPIKNLMLKNIIYRTPGGGSPAVADVPLDKLSTIPEHATAYPEYSMHGELPAFGWFIRHAAGVTLDHDEIDCRKNDSRSAIVCDDVAGLRVRNLRIENVGNSGPVIAFRDVHDASIDDSIAHTTATTFVRLLERCSGIQESANTVR
jgi:hypothetical protein